MKRRPPDPVEPLPASIDGLHWRQLQVYYRSERDGRTWCESHDPAEVAARSLPTDTFSKLVRWQVTAGYSPWAPETEIGTEDGDSPPED